MPAPYPRLSDLAAPRRDMTWQEINALQEQGRQGMQPAYPVSLADLATEGIGSFLEEADLSKYALPLAMLGMVKGPKGAKRMAQAAGEQPAAALAPRAVTSLPPLTENYRKPLSAYAPTLYRETSLYGVHDFLPGTVGDLGDIHVSNVPHLALGQGSNQGVLVEMDSAGLHGQVSTHKPAWQPLWDQGEAEFRITYPKRSDLQESVRSITVMPDAQATKGEKMRFRHIIRGWEAQKNPDGSITYTRPSREPEPVRTATAEKK